MCGEIRSGLFVISGMVLILMWILAVMPRPYNLRYAQIIASDYLRNDSATSLWHK
jgi:hypothetical protein